MTPGQEIPAKYTLKDGHPGWDPHLAAAMNAAARAFTRAAREGAGAAEVIAHLLGRGAPARADLIEQVCIEIDTLLD